MTISPVSWRLSAGLTHTPEAPPAIVRIASSRRTLMSTTPSVSARKWRFSSGLSDADVRVIAHARTSPLAIRNPAVDSPQCGASLAFEPCPRARGMGNVALKAGRERVGVEPHAVETRYVTEATSERGAAQ